MPVVAYPIAELVPVVFEVIVNFSPSHVQVAVTNAAVMIEATAFRFAAPEKSRPVTATGEPFTGTESTPVVIDVQFDIVCCVAVSVPPVLNPEVAVRSQRPIM